MSTSRFAISRADGRSNAQVVLDLVRDGEPGRVYTFDEFASALSEGAEREYDRVAVRSIVAAAYPRLLKEQQRALHNIRGQGYRLAYAHDHNRLALDRKRRSDVQLKRGFQTLQHVRWDEMDENARAAHEGTLMIVGALCQAQGALERRQKKIEDALEKVRNGGV